MPYKTEKQKLDSAFLDRRTKLLPCQKERIFQMYNIEGGHSQRELAQMFRVSRRTIQFIVDPEKRKRNSDQFKERRKDGRYYDKEKHKKAMRTHRKHKNEILKDTVDEIKIPCFHYIPAKEKELHVAKTNCPCLPVMDVDDAQLIFRHKKIKCG